MEYETPRDFREFQDAGCSIDGVLNVGSSRWEEDDKPEMEV
jgi:hypothetical protein